MKRALQKFCDGFEWVIDRKFFMPVFLGTVVTTVLLVIFGAFYASHKEEKKIEEQIQFLERVCKKIGTSLDRGRGYELRTMYQCPDGQIHIR